MSEVNFIAHNERRIRMSQTMMVRNLVALSAITIFLVGLSGCDYWPPALQTQIEQLRSELQSATVEKIQLQNQLASLTKVKDDLQAQVDDLSRANRDKTSMINSLQNSLAAAQERLAKSAKVATPKAPAAKPSAKVTQKAPAKKKTPAKTTGAH
jgi:septal ring factor EnvC (AmiA/AmiB activator)